MSNEHHRMILMLLQEKKYWLEDKTLAVRRNLNQFYKTMFVK